MNALGRAAAQVRADLDRYRIEVRPDEMVIIHGDTVKKLDKYTPYRICLPLLRAIIKPYKEAEAARELDRQVKLF